MINVFNKIATHRETHNGLIPLFDIQMRQTAGTDIYHFISRFFRPHFSNTYGLVFSEMVGGKESHAQTNGWLLETIEP